MRRGVVAVILGLVLVAAGCGSAADVRDRAMGSGAGENGGHAAGAPPADPALSAYYNQRPTWKRCGQYECTSVDVPLDYAKPDGDRVTLQLRRLPAKDRDDRRGSLFINPGGPGGSGVDYVAQFTAVAGDDVLDHYDVVGWDPRGVAASDPLDCGDTAQIDAFVNVDPSPDDAAEEKAYYDASRDLGNRCKELSGALASHVSTLEVAKDLDVLRAVVGDDTLSYLGASYGTMIGATYAQLFPKRVGRMVLDGALDPSLDAEKLNLGQAAGFHTALEAYIAQCVKSATCPLGNDPQAAQQKLKDFLAQLDASPLKTDDPSRSLNESLGFRGIAVTLYNEEYWQLLTRALRGAFGGDGSFLLTLADLYDSRGAGGYKDNSVVALAAVSCLDDPTDISIEQTRASIPEFDKVSPVFGPVFAWSPLSCTAWPIKPTQKPLTITAEGAAPIVVIGTTRDPATPYVWAQAMADQLASGVLISRDGDGHTGYAMGNQCVDDAVDDYLVAGAVPKDGLRC